MERSESYFTEEVSAFHCSRIGLADQFGHAHVDELHRAGNQAWVRFRDGEPLVLVNADTKSACFACYFNQGTVTGGSTGSENNVSTLV